MQKEIPISFDYRGKHYSGILSAVHGAGGGTWYLMINNFFYGQLLLRNGEWRFASNDGMFEDLGQFFGDYVMLYLE